MSETRDTHGSYKEKGHKGPGPELMDVETLIGEHVPNGEEEYLGDIKRIMPDMAEQS